MGSEMDKSSVIASAMIPMLNHAEFKGLRFSGLLDSIDLNPSTFNHPDIRLSTKLADCLIEHAVLETECENFGLIAGQSLVPGNWNITGYIMMACQTLGQALEKFCKYEKIVSDANKTEIFKEKDSIAISLRTIAETEITIKQHTENILSGLIRLMKIFTGREISLKEVHVRHSPSKELSDYENIFQAPIYFNQPMNLLIMDKSCFNFPLLQPNRNLLFKFEQYAKELLKKYDHSHLFTNKVRELLKIKLAEGLTDIEIVAKELAMGVRNLQLKLKTENTSYQMLLDETRKDLAIGHLENRELSIAEVAYSLGFSDPSVFHRAFKKWTGDTPGNYRRDHKCQLALIQKQLFLDSKAFSVQHLTVS